ncbi:ABC transporter permease [Yersinia sp. 2545 StPb PI]|uniref:ABC transporter permease n=1 Tax=Yersinia sp. 2545 StPb PI TaxID=3117410 RepID=UPI003FA4B24A
MFNDLLWALQKPQSWLILSWYDIKQRYKRSTLGPFWVTISTGVLVGMLSILWSTIFKLDVKDYLPFFCIGQVVWTYISMQLTESCTGFTQFEYLIKQSKISFSSILLRILSRNLIVFAHNFIIIFIVITFVSPGWSWMALWAILGFIILTVSLFSMSIILAILCTRFRDLQMIVQNVLLVSFYFTPIMWKTHQLSDKLNYIINFNPLVHFFNIIRDPMLGVAPNFNSMLISICVTIVIFFVSMVFMRKYCARIAYWL